MKLAIYSSAASAYSESFIKMQMERLPCELRIHGGPVASETIPGGPISPLGSLRGMAETAWSVGVQRKKLEGPQSAELARRLRRNGITCLLANYGPGGVALLPACQRAGIPLVVHFHGYDAHRTNVVSAMRSGYRELFNQARAIIAVSSGMESKLIALGAPRDKLHLLRYGVDPGKFAAKSAFPESPVFFSVGRFVDKKAPYLTLLAFSRARERLPGAKLVMAGEGELWEATRNIALALNLGNAVEFPGVLSPESVASNMRKATAFVQHSLEPACGPAEGDREGTPVAVLEAMMTGLPVIATKHAGIGEVVESEHTGVLVAERDVDGMAEAMVRIGTSREFAATLGRRAREVALANYTADRYISSLRVLLESVSK